MAELIDNATTAMEDIMLKIPFCSTPIGRTLVFGGAGAAFAYTVRPAMSFYPDGRPREWILVDRSNPEATLFPYWAYLVIPGALAGIFI